MLYVIIYVESYLTIITFDKKLLPYLEPFAPSPERRLEAVRKLNEAGVRAGVNCTPIVPYLLDDPENIEEVIKRASGCAEYILIGAGMTLRSNQRVRFLEFFQRVQIGRSVFSMGVS